MAARIRMISICYKTRIRSACGRLFPARLSVVAAILVALPLAAAPMKGLHWPAAGRPAVVLPGGAVEVGMGEKGTLRLSADGATYPLALESTREVGGVTRGRAVLPEGIAPGVYALDLVLDGTEERHEAAVHVVPSFESAYSVAVLTGAALAADGTLIPAAAEGLAQAGVSVAFLIGPLFPEGAPATYEAVRHTIASLSIPLFLCPGARDLASPQYHAYFGTPVYSVTFGPDGYLMLGDGLAASAPTSNWELGPAYLARREIRPSRWSTGIAARYGLDWHVRGQMALFADDPLDYLIAGSVPAGIGARVPLGPTRLVPPPTLSLGTLLILDIDDGGVHVREPAPAEE